MAETTGARQRMRWNAKETIATNAATELRETLALIGVSFPDVAGSESAEGRSFVNLGSAPAGEVFTLAHWIRKKLTQP
ncbi:hypothetical protein [Streptomyces sp. NPDC005805]|uniref:hypothetical protein n=1 Tax=Streptomyces sp. NPDC005805 TaxID=3157068 RepID=UPI0034112A8E